MLHLIGSSGILTNVCLGTSRTLRLSSFFLSFFVFLVYCTAALFVFLSWTNKRISIVTRSLDKSSHLTLVHLDFLS